MVLPNTRSVLGISTAAYEAREDAIVADLETLDALGRPDLPREVRDTIAEDDVETVSAQDREDLQTVLDWEEYHI